MYTARQAGLPTTDHAGRWLFTRRRLYADDWRPTDGRSGRSRREVDNWRVVANSHA